MRVRFNILLAASLAAGAWTAGAGAADAAVFRVTYDSADGAAFDGVLTTTDQANANGFFTVTALQGTRGGLAATLLAPGAFGGNDNLFRPTPNYLDVDGFAFAAGGVSYNPYRTTVNATYPSGFAEFIGGGPSLAISNFAVGPVAAVPEPASWVLAVLGVGAAGFGLRRRRGASARGATRLLPA